MSTGSPPRIHTSADAERELADTPYLVYCLVAAAKHFIAIALKRWSELR